MNDKRHRTRQISALIDSAIERKGRGAATHLAEATGVSNATITKWRRGDHRPEEEKWAQIEEALDLSAGDIARAAGLQVGRDHVDERIEALAGQVREMTALIELLWERVGDQTDQVQDRINSIRERFDELEP